MMSSILDKKVILFLKLLVQIHIDKSFDKINILNNMKLFMKETKIPLECKENK